MLLVLEQLVTNFFLDFIMLFGNYDKIIWSQAVLVVTDTLTELKWSTNEGKSKLPVLLLIAQANHLRQLHLVLFSFSSIRFEKSILKNHNKPSDKSQSVFISCV